MQEVGKESLREQSSSNVVGQQLNDELKVVVEGKEPENADKDLAQPYQQMEELGVKEDDEKTQELELQTVTPVIDKLKTISDIHEPKVEQTPQNSEDGFIETPKVSDVAVKPENFMDESQPSTKAIASRWSLFTMESKDYYGLEQFELSPRECERSIEGDKVTFFCSRNPSILDANISFSFSTTEVSSLREKDWNLLEDISIYSGEKNVILGLIFGDQERGEIKIPLNLPEEYLRSMN
ncbi:hypothetical protein [Mycoplasma ovis]|nr:hypothetical protein [Mycoplasma ovis]